MRNIKSKLDQNLRNQSDQPSANPIKSCDVAIIGAGAGGTALAASLKQRLPDVDIILIDPSQHHYYQPGWTLVGAGLMHLEQTQKPRQALIPKNCQWQKSQVISVDPLKNRVELKDKKYISYKALVLACGIELKLDQVKGLDEALGHNGVTSNYIGALAPYTDQLTRSLRKGKAIFTQAAAPIKCAGAPQKAMYLAADYWRKQDCLNQIEINFCSQAKSIFAVADFVPQLEHYLKKYQVNFFGQETLVKVDHVNQQAYFLKEQNQSLVTRDFDFLHVCPPQGPADWLRRAKLADQDGYLDVDPFFLQHSKYENIFGVGDILNTPNAKTAAAARKQAPVVANNLSCYLNNQPLQSLYNGYGGCPLTVERGRIILAEFAYQQKLDPTLPNWLLQGTKPTRLAWLLKRYVMPYLYWHGMMKGHEWLAKPETIPSKQITP